jgi:hypothetical protein
MGAVMRKALFVLLGLVAVPVHAQWRTQAPAPDMRPGQPQVIAPAPQPSAAAPTPWASLRSRLGARNRVMLFWESELEDGVATRYRVVETVDRSTRASAAQAEGVAYTYDGPVGVSVAGASAGTHQRTEKFLQADAPSNPRARGESRAIQSQFMDELRQGGVRFIDRTLATRLTGQSADGERPNVHAIETRALAGHADYLLQVTSTADPDVASGRGFHVALLAVANGETLLAFDTTAEPPATSPRRYVATDGGFERAAADPVGATDIARALALETAQRMDGALRR